MLCYHCKYASTCTVFREVYRVSSDFCINKCRNYQDVSEYKYQKIADHDDLMHLIYDYFTDQIKGGCSADEVKDVIINALLNL